MFNYFKESYNELVNKEGGRTVGAGQILKIVK